MKKFDTTVVHVGIHKTGTTFLQKEVFPKLREAHFARWEIDIEEVINEESENLIISNESLSGRPWGIENQGYMTLGEKRYNIGGNKMQGNSERNTWIDDFEEKIIKISNTFPDAGVAICFRKHDEIINSLYKQYILEGGTGRLRSLFDIERNKGIVKKKDLYYMERVQIIRKYLETEPYVFLYEDIKEDYKSCICEMMTYFDIEKDGIEDTKSRKHNASKGKYRYEIIRAMNKLKVKRNVIGKLARKKIIDNIKYKILDKNILDFEEKQVIKNSTKKKIRDNYKEDWRNIKSYSRAQV